MSDKINVGVFPCGSEVGLEINRALKYYRHFHLIGLSSVHDHGRIAYKNYIGGLPFINDDHFIGKIKSIVEENNLRFLIPAMDEVGYMLKKNESYIDCEVVYPELDITGIIRKKSTTYKKLSDHIPTPKLYNDIKEAAQNLPLFVKPDIGYGSRGAFKVETKHKLESVQHKLDESVLMEYLPGEEFTIDCFSSLEGELLFSGARKRSRIRMGISVATEAVQNQPIFQDIAEKINRVLGLKGIWFFQLKRDKTGILTLLEVAGRVSGSMALYRGLGINFIASDLFQRLGNNIKFPNLNADNGTLERSFDCTVQLPLEYETVYCDLDDCLIVDDKINTNLVRFLYQCVNDNKNLILVTRHQKIPQKTLNDIRLTALFDEIIHIEDEVISKATAIKGGEKSIFIDDSFAERQSVNEVHNIPTFAPDAVDLLISKKQ